MRNPFRRDAAPEPEPAPLCVEQEEELRALAREQVRPGFTDRTDLVAMLEDHELEDADPRSQEAAARRIAGEEWTRREAELAASPGTGDYGRLAAAFDALGEQGVLGRMGFTCCQTCGTTEIDDERTRIEPAAGSTYGFAEWAYTFFHQQDAERLAEPGSPLFLTFSSFRASPDVDPDDLAASRAGDVYARRRIVAQTDVIVGGLVRDALVAQGLEVTWDGTAGQRIQVSVPDWRKPLPVD